MEVPQWEDGLLFGLFVCLFLAQTATVIQLERNDRQQRANTEPAGNGELVPSKTSRGVYPFPGVYVVPTAAALLCFQLWLRKRAGQDATWTLH